MTAHISDDGRNREESVAEHTEKTAFLCGEKGKRCGLSRLTSLCGLIHDVGKCKQTFASYIHADENTKRKLRGSIAHASTGAKCIYDRYHGSAGNTKVMAEMIAYAVAAHHGLFDCVDSSQMDLFSGKMERVEDYEKAVRNAGREYLDAYELDEIFRDAACEFNEVWEKIKGLFGKLKYALQSGNGGAGKEALSACRLFLLSCLQRLILSILIDSDWEATSDFMDDIDTLSKQPAFDAKEVFEKAGINFEAYMQRKRQAVVISKLTDKEKTIFEARNSLQKECRQFAQHPAGIYCLPLPTGGGKTLTGLAYALEFGRLHPETERIIYVSPYISVTEQNAQVFREAIGNRRY